MDEARDGSVSDRRIDIAVVIFKASAPYKDASGQALPAAIAPLRPYGLALVMAYSAFFSISLLVPLWLQRNLGYTAIWVGFATAPIGPSLVALDNGLTLTTLANTLSIARTARVTVFHATGTRGAEFALTGDDPLVAAVGAVRQGASLAVMAGADAEGIAWRLDTGSGMRG